MDGGGEALGEARLDKRNAKPPLRDLSRRERQLMEVLYRNGRATAAEAQQQMPDPPGYSAVRAMLRVLEEKGHIRHEREGLRYVYVPTVGVDRAKRSALRHLVQTFFEGSSEKAVAALIDDAAPALDAAELDRLKHLIDQARKGGRA